MPRTKLFNLTVLLGVGVFALSGLSYFYWDQSLSIFFSDERLSALREFNRWITDFGLADYYFIAVILGYLISRLLISWLKFDRMGPWSLKVIRQESLFALQSLLLSGFAIQVIKALTGRQRPHLTADFDPTVFKPLTVHWHWHSFPSGHSQVIFCVATLLGIWNPRFQKIFWLLAAVVAFSRVPTHQHFLSDVLVGSYLGLFITLWWNQRRQLAFDQKLKHD